MNEVNEASPASKTSDVERVVICQKCSLPIDTKNVAHALRNWALFHNDCLIEGMYLAGGKEQARELGGLMVEARRKRIWL